MNEGNNAIEKITPAAEPSIGLLLAEIIKQGVTTENVAALDKLCDLYERVEVRKSEREFNAAFSQMQKEMPSVAATVPVPNKDGSIRYRYAPFEEIMQKVQPILTQHGFSVSFDTRHAEGRLVVSCKLRHVSGHSQINEFAVRIGGGPPGSTETQADGAAKTYAKRGALSDALNIVIDKDDDARFHGAPVTEEQAWLLEKRVKATGANEAAFLRFAGAESYAEISADRFPALDMLLKRKEGTAK